MPEFDGVASNPVSRFWGITRRLRQIKSEHNAQLRNLSWTRAIHQNDRTAPSNKKHCHPDKARSAPRDLLQSVWCSGVAPRRTIRLRHKSPNHRHPAVGRHPEERSDEGSLFDFNFLPRPLIHSRVPHPSFLRRVKGFVEARPTTRAATAFVAAVFRPPSPASPFASLIVVIPTEPRTNFRGDEGPLFDLKYEELPSQLHIARVVSARDRI